jgi:hypothetical protein
MQQVLEKMMELESRKYLAARLIADVNTGFNKMILQREITLDEAIQNANIHGKFNDRYYTCNWAFYIQPDGTVLMGYGCDGVYVNLVTGIHKLIYHHFIDNIDFGDKLNTDAKIKLDISAETKQHILRMYPCPKCGNPFFKV